MSFYTSLSGLQAAQTDLSTISHNLANVSTNGFKKSRTEFADVMATSVTTSPTSQIGSGTVVRANRQQFGQGPSQQSTSGLDLAISGDGFFAVKPNVDINKVNYTRNGGFSVNDDHYVVDANGGHLQVYPVDGSGAVVASDLDNAISLKLPETSGVAVPTTSVKYTTNFSSNAALPTQSTFSRFDPKSYNQSTSSTIYDSSGNAITMTSYFARESISDGTTDSTWRVYSFIGDDQLKSGNGANSYQTMTFDKDGVLKSGGSVLFDDFTPSGATMPQAITLEFSNKTTQVAAPFSVSDKSQNGMSVGALEGVTVDGEGMVKASFSNGDVQNLGKVMLVKFSNPSGLRQLGNSYWTQTGISGEAQTGAAGSPGYGNIMSNMVERSNVDITEELVALIAAQRNFQANSKALDTASQISQTIFNIRS
ncbi:flagellar hook protein FlgE [Sphingomonas corticis]|jgi:flagellar hook protein FlgE|uniref:Flagellar hook protein FlgE n=1 Tax=Sphingomonas corticis TaxID=2722791 RepID=A0ABX1CUW2_9SPHN|nr:flagellar hook protein FlgE [Sphingomonas corticis]NJR79760.1 flagellar hook protein FlgE [Sphingomonas corticis]